MPNARSSIPAPLPTTETALLDVAWTDANAVTAGVCFEAALDAAGRTFTLRSEAELAQFFDEADHSRLCRRPVERGTFDFSGGSVLMGTWSVGRGCTARHDVIAFMRDDIARTLALTVQFVTEGDCPYELVRPFWIGLPGAATHTLTLVIMP